MLNFEKAIPHDTIIRKIEVNRASPGENDSITFKLEINDAKFELLFTDVYCARFDLNFGVIAEESIREVSVESNNNEIKEILDRWQMAETNVDRLKCFKLTTNSTNSVMRVYAKAFSLTEDFSE